MRRHTRDSADRTAVVSREVHEVRESLLRGEEQRAGRLAMLQQQLSHSETETKSLIEETFRRVSRLMEERMEAETKSLTRSDERKTEATAELNSQIAELTRGVRGLRQGSDETAARLTAMEQRAESRALTMETALDARSAASEAAVRAALLATKRELGDGFAVEIEDAENRVVDRLRQLKREQERIRSRIYDAPSPREEPPLSHIFGGGSGQHTHRRAARRRSSRGRWPPAASESDPLGSGDEELTGARTLTPRAASPRRMVRPRAAVVPKLNLRSAGTPLPRPPPIHKADRPEAYFLKGEDFVVRDQVRHDREFSRAEIKKGNLYDAALGLRHWLAPEPEVEIGTGRAGWAPETPLANTRDWSRRDTWQISKTPMVFSMATDGESEGPEGPHASRGARHRVPTAAPSSSSPAAPSGSSAALTPGSQHAGGGERYPERTTETGGTTRSSARSSDDDR
jgi:hypothetical protein